MKEGEIDVAHGSNWFGVLKLQKMSVLTYIGFKGPDGWEYREVFCDEDGEIEYPPFSSSNEWRPIQ